MIFDKRYLCIRLVDGTFSGKLVAVFRKFKTAVKVPNQGSVIIGRLKQTIYIIYIAPCHQFILKNLLIDSCQIPLFFQEVLITSCDQENSKNSNIYFVNFYQTFHIS